MKLTIYRIFSFLLIPVAVLFGICVLLMIGAALSNPVILMPVFMLACIVIYSFAALNFLIKGIDGKKYFSRRSKYWLKITAIVSVLFALLIISQCLILLIHPEAMQQAITDAQSNFNESLPVSKVMMENFLRGTSYFFLVYSVILALHVMLSFQHLELYNYLFRDNTPS